MTYATALNRSELFESPGLRREIPDLLHPEENVLLVLPGVAGDFPNVLIATSSRVMLAAVAGPLKRANVKREIPATVVAGVQYRPGIFSRVHVQSNTGRDIKMMPHRKADATRFTSEFERLLRTGSLP